MARVLILYSSSEGQTEKIAHYINDQLSDKGLQVDCMACTDVGGEFDFRGFDLVVVGASIHYDKHSRDVVACVTRYHACWQDRASAFFSVSGLAIRGDDKAKRTVQKYITAFLTKTGWQPDWVAPVAGAIMYRKYGWLKRMAMKFLSWKMGLHTDTRRNHEYTDWRVVDRFVQRLLRML